MDLIKIQDFYTQKTTLRKQKDKQQTGKRHLQNTYLRKDFYIEFTKTYNSVIR